LWKRRNLTTKTLVAKKFLRKEPGTGEEKKSHSLKKREVRRYFTSTFSKKRRRYSEEGGGYPLGGKEPGHLKPKRHVSVPSSGDPSRLKKSSPGDPALKQGWFRPLEKKAEKRATGGKAPKRGAREGKRGVKREGRGECPEKS